MPSGVYLTDKERKAICNAIEQGGWPVKIAKEYGISKRTVIEVAKSGQNRNEDETN